MWPPLYSGHYKSPKVIHHHLTIEDTIVPRGVLIRGVQIHTCRPSSPLFFPQKKKAWGRGYKRAMLLARIYEVRSYWEEGYQRRSWWDNVRIDSQLLLDLHSCYPPVWIQTLMIVLVCIMFWSQTVRIKGVQYSYHMEHESGYSLRRNGPTVTFTQYKIRFFPAS
jgi:hypothetical protein